MKFSRALAASATLLLLTACNQDTNKGPSPVGKTEVGYITMNTEPVEQVTTLRGRVVAYATAEVRPQVAGIIRKIAFTEGREVKEGDVLFEIDPSKFKAARASASAALKKAQAATKSAQATYDRNKVLQQTKAVSAQVAEDAESALLQAQATEEAAKADLETAQINLDNATIRAPITGQIGIAAVSVGSLVTENQTDALVTIRQIDPINVDLMDTSANLLRMRDQIDEGQIAVPRGVPLAAALTLENGKAYDGEGKVSLADMIVGETTGSFTVRATFPNEKRVLIPGMFVSASLKFGTMTNTFLIPQRAVTRGDDGKATIYLVSADDTAKLVEVTTSGSSGNDWIVTKGVSAGDKVIVDGFQKISDGSAIEPVAASIDDDGVVKQTIASDDSAEGGK